MKKLSIFISHASGYLTDHAQHGDGLVAYGFVRELARRGHRLFVATPVADLVGPLPENVHLHVLPPRTGNKVLRRLDYMIRSRRLLDEIRRKEHIDLIHQLNPVDRGLSLSMWGSGLPLVLGTFVGDWKERPQRGLRDVLTQITKSAVDIAQQSAADALLVATPYARNRVPAVPGIERKIFSVSHGIDIAHFTPPASAASPSNEILFLNRIAPSKGIFTLLDAFEIVGRQLPESSLTITGTGGAVPAVKERVVKSELRDRIHLTGHVEHTDVATAMASCALLCLPSFGEPYGQAVLEAMACGKPVVVTAAGGVRYLVPDEGGRKVPPGDHVALAAALVEILSSPELQGRMGATNRRAIEQQHDWERIGGQLEKVYDAVLSARHAVAYSSPA